MTTVSVPRRTSAQRLGAQHAPVHAGGAPQGSRERAAEVVEGTGLLFYGFLLLLLLEYIGLARLIPVLQATRFSTLLAYSLFLAVLMKFGAREFLQYRQTKLLLTLLGMAALSIVYAVVRSYVPTTVRYQAGYIGLFAVTLALVDRPLRIKQLAVVGTVIVVALVALNPNHLTSSVRMGSFRAAYFMGDGNDFAWGMITLLPFPLFLLMSPNGMAWRLFGLFGAACGLLGVVGTQSRGATLGLATAAVYYWLVVGRRRVVGIIVIAVVASAIVMLAPESYRTRMQGVDLDVDTSSQGRLRAWGSAIEMALDYPLGVGAGNFNSAYGRFYRAPDLYGADSRWISAHSIYFKVLGEYGFLGLFLLFAVLWKTFRINAASVQSLRTRASPAGVSDHWPALLNFGLVGYSVAGAFLGGTEYPHLYVMSGLAIGCTRLIAAEPRPPTTLAIRPPPRPTRGVTLWR